MTEFLDARRGLLLQDRRRAARRCSSGGIREQRRLRHTLASCPLNLSRSPSFHGTFVLPATPSLPWTCRRSDTTSSFSAPGRDNIVVIFNEALTAISADFEVER